MTSLFCLIDLLISHTKILGRLADKAFILLYLQRFEEVKVFFRYSEIGSVGELRGVEDGSPN